MVCPKLWLTSESGGSSTFCDAVADMVADVPSGVGGWPLDGPSTVRQVWATTQMAFRALNINSAAEFLTWLSQQNDTMHIWMSTTSRYQDTRPVPPPTQI
eukprot:9684866-Karenia_brevis.AAC.1